MSFSILRINALFPRVQILLEALAESLVILRIKVADRADAEGILIRQLAGIDNKSVRLEPRVHIRKADIPEIESGDDVGLPLLRNDRGDPEAAHSFRKRVMVCLITRFARLKPSLKLIQIKCTAQCKQNRGRRGEAEFSVGIEIPLLIAEVKAKRL